MTKIAVRNIDIDASHAEVLGLIDTFHRFRSRYTEASYSETALRDDYIKQFLWALGWDVEHRLQQDPLQQEVKVERNVSVGAGKKRADYALFIGPKYRRGEERLFVEVKKPSVSLAHPKNYFQAVRYGWSVGNPLVVLTNFDELHVLDCRYPPDIDTINECRIPDYIFKYGDLKDRDTFARLFYLISRQAVAGGSLERVGSLLPKRRGKAIQRGLFPGAYLRVDETFLVDLHGFRERLARSLKSKNLWLDSEALTEITQRILDRLIFLRFLEDKLIETRVSIGAFGTHGTIWGDFVAASRKLDSTYNGIVFKPHSLIDEGKLDIDERVFGDICEELSSENTKYDFNTIPVHLLGSIYEGFLGKVITADAENAKLEDKPEVRKAGGVFYTPEYVVRYVVDHTVGALIEGKTPHQISEMKYADISCGSGSFLLGIYDCLIRYHTRWYNANIERAPAADVIEEDDGSLRVSLKRKREILVRCIFGVDIDHQAVEVAQLSLFLKLLEEESTSSARFFQHELHETLLPSMNRNVVAGNSLIGTDILMGRTFTEQEEMQLNPMNFEDRFRSIMADGGFNAVLGNPPWGATITEPKYLKEKFSRVVTRMPDTYIYFIDQAIRHLRKGGVMGYVIPGTVLNQVDATDVRKLMLEHGVHHALNLGQEVFGPKVLNTTAILITGDGIKASNVYIGDLSEVAPNERDEALNKLRPTPRRAWTTLVESDPHFTFFASATGPAALLSRLRKKHSDLEAYLLAPIQRGVTPDVAAAHVIPNDIAEDADIEPEVLRNGVSGPQIRRYATWASDQKIIYTTRDTPIQNYPRAKSYLSTFRVKNKCPEVRDGKHPWWSLHRPRSPEIFDSPKFIGLTTTKAIEIVYDETENLVVTDAMYVFALKSGIDPWAFMAVMHSSTMLFLYRVSNQGEGRVIPQVKASKLQTLPFPKLTANKTLQENLAADCQAMIETKEKLRAAKVDRQQDYYANRCVDLEARIDDAVFKLYGLTEAEAEMVRAGAKS